MDPTAPSAVRVEEAGATRHPDPAHGARHRQVRTGLVHLARRFLGPPSRREPGRLPHDPRQRWLSEPHFPHSGLHIP